MIKVHKEFFYALDWQIPTPRIALSVVTKTKNHNVHTMRSSSVYDAIITKDEGKQAQSL